MHHRKAHAGGMKVEVAALQRVTTQMRRWLPGRTASTLVGGVLWAMGLMAQEVPLPAFNGPYGISGIMVEGNRQTKEHVIIRELTFNEGDTLAPDALYERLERSRQNLMNLGLFNTVELMPTFLGPHEVFITVTVNERWYWWPQPRIHIADPNFNTWWLTKDLRRLNYGIDLYRSNLRGRNETLVARVQLGYSKAFGLAYRVPFIDRRQRWGVQLAGGYGEQDEITIGTTDNKRTLLRTPTRNIIHHWSTEGALTLRQAHDVRHAWSLAWHHTTVRDTVVHANPQYLLAGVRETAFPSIGYSLIVDERDSRAFPLKGRYVKVQARQHGLGGSQPDVTALQATLQQSWLVGQRWSLGAGLNGKTSRGTQCHYFLQEGLGYDQYLRGYEYYVIDGQHFVLGKFNALFTLIKPRSYRIEAIPLEPFRTVYIALYLNIFSDQGYVWDRAHGRINPLSNQWQQSYGIGLDLVTSYDQVVRVEGTVNGLRETGFYLHFTQPF